MLYVATAQALDADMERRIANHRQQRPAEWDTLEEPLKLPDTLPSALDGYDTCLLDCLTLWVSNLLLSMEEDSQGRPHPNPVLSGAEGPPPEGKGITAEQEILSAARRLLAVYEQSAATLDSGQQ